MRMHPSRIVAGSLLALAATACVFDATISDSGVLPVILCTESDECPPAWRCGAGRCLPNDLEDVDAPAFTVSTLEDEAVDVELCATARIVDGARAGALTLEGSDVRYVPDDDFFGRDTFTYTCEVAGVVSAPATVTIDVTAVNDAPACASPFGITVQEDADIAVDIVPCSDVDGDDLTIAIVGAPTVSGATAELFAGGAGTAVAYRPAPDHHGDDTLTLSATDASGATVAIEVNVHVAAVNDAPVAPAVLTATTDRGVAIDLPVAATDVDGDALTLVLVEAPADATVTLDGLVAHVHPAQTKVGPVVLTLRARDARGAESGDIAVTLVVRAAASCALLKNTVGGADGVEEIALDEDDGTALVSVWCDQTRNGGGWSLVGVIDGRHDFVADGGGGVTASEWRFATDWEVGSTAGASDLTGVVSEPAVEARFAAYAFLPFTDVMIVARTPADDGEQRDVVLHFPRQDSMLATMAARKTVLTLPAPGAPPEDDAARRLKWLALVPGARQQASYGVEGFFVRGLGSATDTDGDGVTNASDAALEDPCVPNGSSDACLDAVRLGFVTDDVVAQGVNPDAWIGVQNGQPPFAGAHCTNTGDGDCDADPNTPGIQAAPVASVMWLYVRDADFTALGDAPSCEVHASRGASVPGVYRVQNTPARCFDEP